MTTDDLTFFFLAAQNGDIFVLKKCLNNGIDIHSNNDLALRLAVKENHAKAIVFLLTRGANAQAVYNSSLQEASLVGDIQTVKSLLRDNLCSEEAKIYAMYNAIFTKNEEIIKLLLQNGVSPTANNKAVLNVVKLCNNSKINDLFKEYLK